jgi:hypothetical protein
MTGVAGRPERLGYVKLSQKLDELSEVCRGQEYDRSKLGSYMRTLRAQVKSTVRPQQTFVEH